MFSMRKALISAATLLILAGCETPPHSHYDYPPAYTPPPPQPAYAPYHAPARPTEVVVHNVKPIGAGVLTAQKVEAYTDTEETELRVALHGSGVIVGRLGNDLLINMKSDPLFETNSAAFSGRASETFAAVAYVVRKYDSTQLQVNGYTDTSGSPEHNLQLSQARANAIAKALTDDGVDMHRVLARGFGEKGLKVPTGNNANEPRNRRIEIRITPRMAT
jgi:outer membrane protein OmpA-like peptidoglycan-associated protein